MGDQQTGVAIMVMDAGMDTGPVLIQKSMPIAPDTTTELLGHQLAEMGAAALCDVLPDYLLGHLKPTPQGLEGVTLAPKISKDMGLLDCRNDAHQLVRKVNALHPWPGTWLLIAGEKVTILKASAVDIPENPFTSGVLVDDASGDPKADLWHTPGHTQGTPGQAFKVASQHTAHAHPQISQAPHGIQDVLPGHIIPWAQDWAVVCGQNTLLCPSVLRAPNGKIMDAGAFMRGYRALLGL
jgi:methionyl-tRNA formyltransferase